ncbi:MAG: DUF4857 domain-containing protein [Muribaculaceae bacterium]|nr:DUF4857 domain-containing protein [Muribaculaceae bacterium]
MKTASHILLTVMAIIGLSWFLPWLYDFMFPVNDRQPFVAYSPVAEKMIFTLRDGVAGDMTITDLEGNIYDKDQRDSLLPHQFFPQLMSKGSLPDSIAGREVSMPALRRSQVVFVSDPSDINRAHPGIYPILESLPPRLEFKNPSEVFRMNGSMEFIDIATNSINSSRSQRFTEALDKAGFRYPMTDCNANITTRKSYDEGYLMIDADGDVYHVKQQAGRPYVAKVPRPTPEFRASKVFIMENFDRSRLGLVIGDNGDVYLLNHEDYTLHHLPIGTIDPTRERITLMGNMFNWAFRISGDSGTRWRFIDTDSLDLLDSYDFKVSETTSEKVGKYIFPYRLVFTSATDRYVTPRIIDISKRALLFNAVLAALLSAMVIRRRSNKLPRIITVLVFGIFAFIPMAIIKD